MISIVIPTYNRAAMVCRAVESCLAEPIVNRQVVVVDDGSTDDTELRLQQYAESIEFRRMDKNQGVQAARNLGTMLATQPYVKYLDSDDYLQPGSLAEELARAESERADIVISAWGSITADSVKATTAPPQFGSGEQIVDDVLLGKGVHTTAALYRLDYLNRHNVRWSADAGKLDDWDFFAHAALGLGRISARTGVSYWQVGHNEPRITDVSLLENARCHHQVLARIESKVQELGLLTQARKTRLAAYHFKELQVFARYDWSGFLRGLRNIQRLDPALDVEQVISNPQLGKLARYLGIKPAFWLYAKYRGK